MNSITHLYRLCRPLSYGIVAVLFLCAATSACTPASAQQISAQQVTVMCQQRPIPAFTAIESHGFVDVVVEKGPGPSLVLEGEQNALSAIETRVANATLTISVRPGTSVRTRHSIVAYVKTSRLESVNSSGSGDVQVGPVAGEHLEILVRGSGDVRADGIQRKRLKVRVHGSGDVWLARAETLAEVKPVAGEHLEILVGGSGDVRAAGIQQERVTVNIHGSGDVWLDGAATLAEVQQSGSGDVHAADLAVQRVQFGNSGSGDLDVYASAAIQGVGNGSGDVRVHGNPPVYQIVMHGSGEVR